MTRIAGYWMALAVAAVLAGGNPNAKAQGVPAKPDEWPSREDAGKGMTPKSATEEAVVDTSQSLNRTEMWPAGGAVPEGNKLYLVTLAEPKRRQTCVVKALALDEIVCKRHGGKVAIYRRSELEAVVRAGASRAVQHIFQGLAVVGGVAIWAGYFVGPVSPAGGIVLRVVGGLLIFVSLESLAWDNDDYSERLVYLKSGETLQVKLR